jgi:hypothetical protein
LKLPLDIFHSLPMSRSWVMKELTNPVHSKGQVGMS